MGERTAVAVVGIGETAYTRRSGRSEWELAVEAIIAALRDASLEPKDVDGLVRFSYDNVDEAMVVRSLGSRLRYYSETAYGGLGAPGLVAHAAAAIQAGQARIVVCYRALNGRSGTRFGRAERSLDSEGPGPDFVARGDRAPSGAFAGPYGLLSPGQVMATWARRYQWECGIDETDLVGALARVAIDQRAYAVRNPRALTYGKPLNLESYLEGRMISTPLRLYDFALESDGAAAIVVADRSVVSSTPNPPVWVLGAVQGLYRYAESIAIYGELRNGPTYRLLADKWFDELALRRTDLAAAMIYDATSVSVLLGLEGYGLVPLGSAWRALLDHGLGPDSPMPINTNGGHLSEAYVHGVNLVVEAVRQCRGQSHNQVRRSGPVLVSSGPSAVMFNP